MDINLFTAAMRAEFLKATQIVGEPAPHEKLITVVPSTARLENYSWMTPTPGIQEYVGRRRIAQVDQIKYTIQNIQYDSGVLSVPLIDLDDDQTGGYKTKFAEMGMKAGKPFVSRKVMRLIADGASNLCFDGTNFFATSHTYGTTAAAPANFGGGGNALTYTASGAATSNTPDSKVHKFVLVIHKPEQALKPFIVQNRQPAKLVTDAGTPESLKAQKADYWVDLRAGFGYGFWWDALQVTITNTPTLLELIACVDGAVQHLKSFGLPTSLPADPIEYIHEQFELSANLATVVCPPSLERMFRHLLKEDRIGVAAALGATGVASQNMYVGMFGLIVTGQLSS
jgi:phage major head subunit gpT-like protein